MLGGGENLAKQFPYLKGKAAEMKHFAPALLHVCEEALNDDNVQHKRMILGLKMAMKMDDILDNHVEDYKLPVGPAAEFEKCCWAFVQLNTALGHHFHAARICLFNHNIKFHYLLHIGMCAKYLSPRKTWCYGGEAMMKIVKQLVQACQAGCPPPGVVSKVMRKYAQGLGMALQDSMWKRK